MVHRHLFHQCRTSAHGHAADDLAARGFRIEDAPGGAHGQLPTQANFAGRRIDRDFGEMRAEGLLGKTLGQIAVFHAVLARQLATGCGLSQGNLLRACANLCIKKLGLLRVKPDGASSGFTQFHARGIHAGSGGGGSPLAPEPDDSGNRESPKCTTTRSSGTPIISAAVWAMMV